MVSSCILSFIINDELFIKIHEVHTVKGRGGKKRRSLERKKLCCITAKALKLYTIVCKEGQHHWSKISSAAIVGKPV